MKRPLHIIMSLVLVMACTAMGRAQTTRPIPAIDRAVVISIDGLRPDVLLRAKTPHLRDLFQHGSFSFWARTTDVAITLPSHVSMLTGVTPDRHGVTWNGNPPKNKDPYPRVPTLFELAKKAGYTTAMVTGKSKFVALDKPGTVDWAIIPKVSWSNEQVADKAARLIAEHQPQLLFVHLADVDWKGHSVGWGTEAQLQAVQSADKAVGTVLEALKKANVLDSTFILVSADHGGTGRSHGANDPRSRYIPWIAYGPGIRQGVDLTTEPKLDIRTEDTFATVCTLLGIAPPRGIDGQFISQIVDHKELSTDAHPGSRH